MVGLPISGNGFIFNLEKSDVCAVLRAVSWPRQLFCGLMLILPVLSNCHCCCCSAVNSDLCASQKLINEAWAAAHCVIACIILS